MAARRAGCAGSWLLPWRGDGCLPVERSYGEDPQSSAIGRRAGDAGVSPLRLLLLGGVGLVTGAVNTVAGGGSLLSFPALLALGYSPLAANVTNTIGVFPSSAGGSVGYRRELVGQARSWVLLAAICTVGSLIGAWLLLVLPASSFEAAVPVLIATAAVLTAVVNGVAAVAFAFLGPVVWSAALVLAGTTMVGGMLGAVVARRLSDRALRLAVVAIGFAAAVYSAVR